MDVGGQNSVNWGKEHKNKQDEKTNAFIVWQRDEIGKLIREVSEIRVPMIMETNEDVIQNAYHLIIADYERVKSLLYKKSDLIAIRSFLARLTDGIIRWKILN